MLISGIPQLEYKYAFKRLFPKIEICGPFGRPLVIAAFLLHIFPAGSSRHLYILV